MPTVYEIVTAQITAALEAGAVPWRRPWTASYARPRNAMTQQPYRGINTMLLDMAGQPDPRWLTFRQALALGGHVRKGEHGMPIVFWKKTDQRQKERTNDDGSTTAVIEVKEYDRAILKYFTVFNVAQVEGLDLLPIAATSGEPPDPIEQAERIIEAMPQRPPIYHDGGSRAYYVPIADAIHLPQRAHFTGSEEYYGTAFHELTHSTGHAKRLNRHGMETGIAAFGSAVYSREELAAEMGAAFLCAEAGISPATLENSAAYIASWLKALKSDPRMVVIAAGQGQKAADFILRRSQPEQQPQEEAAAVAA